MNETTPITLVKRFMAAINAHDVDHLGELMSVDHVFVDSLGQTVRGRDAMLAAWRHYFSMVPDYWISCEYILAQRDVVAVLGKAGGTVARNDRLEPENKWEVPAAWKATVRQAQIAAWQVYADNEPVRQL